MRNENPPALPSLRCQILPPSGTAGTHEPEGLSRWGRALFVHMEGIEINGGGLANTLLECAGSLRSLTGTLKGVLSEKD